LITGIILIPTPIGVRRFLGREKDQGLTNSERRLNDALTKPRQLFYPLIFQSNTGFYKTRNGYARSRTVSCIISFAWTFKFIALSRCTHISHIGISHIPVSDRSALSRYPVACVKSSSTKDRSLPRRYNYSGIVTSKAMFMCFNSSTPKRREHRIQVWRCVRGSCVKSNEN
jgi:hypothetical protein